MAEQRVPRAGFEPGFEEVIVADTETAAEPPERTLLGWVVPEHITWVVTDGYVELDCRQDTSTATTSVQNREWVHGFLTQHAHGATIEAVTAAVPVGAGATNTPTPPVETDEGDQPVLRAGDAVDVFVGINCLQGTVKHFGNATGPLIVSVPVEERIP